MVVLERVRTVDGFGATSILVEVPVAVVAVARRDECGHGAVRLGAGQRDSALTARRRGRKAVGGPVGGDLTEGSEDRAAHTIQLASPEEHTGEAGCVQLHGLKGVTVEEDQL